MMRHKGKAVARLFALWLALFVGLALLWKGLTALIPFTAWPLLLLFGQLHLLLRLAATSGGGRWRCNSGRRPRPPTLPPAR